MSRAPTHRSNGPPRLDHITIRGFRSIRALDDFELRGLNVFVGANGAGKSNLIAFFRLLRALMEDRLETHIRTHGGIGDLLFGGRKTTSEIHCSLRFGPRGYRFRLEPTVSEGVLLRDEARYFRGERAGFVNRGWWELGDSPDGSSRLAAEVAGAGAEAGYSRRVRDAIRSFRVYQFHDTSPTAGMRYPQPVEDNERLRTDGSNLAPFLLRLRSDHLDSYREIVETFKLVAPWFDDFRLRVESFGPREKVRLSWRARGTDHPMQPHHFSDGSLRFLCLAAALLQPDPPAAVLLDEPELGLHPLALEVLAEIMQTASGRPQIIVATQSPHFLDPFTIEDIVTATLREGETRFQRLDEEEYAAWLDHYRIGELWCKNVLPGGPIYA